MAVAKLTKKDARAEALTASKKISRKLTKTPKKIPPYNVKLIALSQEAKSSGNYISNILGFHQISANEFCVQFNQFSEHILNSVPIPVIITKKEKTFNLKLKEPTLETLIFSCLLQIPEEIIQEDINEEYYFIPQGLSKLMLFDIIRIKSTLLSLSIYTTAKICFGTLASLHLSSTRRLTPNFIF